MPTFSFTSYGVKTALESNSTELLKEAVDIARASLLGNLKPYNAKKADVTFRLDTLGPQSHRMYLNGELNSVGRSRWKFLKFFDSLLRATVGEYAPHLVFIHAGVVGWKGKAILMPADSFKGKSTITAELVRRGASYYSDDFAILDKNGLVHAFPRTISMRDERYRPFDIEPELLGGSRTEKPIPLGMVLFTEFKPRARWRPMPISTGRGVLEAVPYLLSFRRDPAFCLKVLNSAFSRAIIASSPRGNAEAFAPLILDYVDKNAN